MSLASRLPAPRSTVEIETVTDADDEAPAFVEPPPYGRRSGFVPRDIVDFGDGGAFPEIHVLQYPLHMGRQDRKQTKVVPLKVDAEGNVKYDVILRQGQRANKHIASGFLDMVGHEATENELARPTPEEEQKIAERTRAALGQIVDRAQAQQQVTNLGKGVDKNPQFIRYTPSQQGNGFNSGANQRIIRLQEMPTDPLEPPKFKHKKIPGGPPSPPVPVMHSPPRKITVADQQNWKIPPCISNWKNIKGYTIPLDKRLVADGRSMQEVQINDKFAKLTESLFIAERTARKEIEARATMQKKILVRQKELKEDKLRDLASRSRRIGRGLEADTEEGEAAAEGGEKREEESYSAASTKEVEKEEDIDARDARDELRRDRKREIKREYAQEKRKADKRAAKGSGGRGPDRERDVSEQIALGQNVPKSRDAMFDQRLFNQSGGMDSGFGSEENYTVFDKALFKGSSANAIYRPKATDSDVYGGDDKLQEVLEKNTAKFTADRGFAGTEGGSAGARDKPVEFEREEADPFGLGQLLTDAKRGHKKALDGIGRSGHMSASAGSAAGATRDSHGGGGGGRKRGAMEFEEGSGGSSSSSSGRDRDRDDDRRSKRSRRD